MAKILLVYPNASGIRRIPLGLACLVENLDISGHEVELFDTTFYVKGDTDNEKREELGIVKKVDMTSLYKSHASSDPVEDFHSVVEKFQPDLIGITLLQDNYHLTKKLLTDIRDITKAYIVAGGIMPSIVPEFVLRTLNIDAVMLGECEKAFSLLATILNYNNSRRYLFGIPNLMFKSYCETSGMGYVFVNPILGLEKISKPSYRLFDEEHLWRPFIGKSWKTGYVELTRGCPFKCTFCANTKMNSIYENRRVRSKPIDEFIAEVVELKNIYKLTLFSFCDENFLSLNIESLRNFSEEWSRKVNLPFMIQARAECITEERVSYLEDAGCATVSIGIECGNEQFRREILNRNYSNRTIIEAFSILKKAGIRSTANNMLGFPFETEEHVKETVKLNIAAAPDSVSLAMFSPYLGCELHKYCVEEGLIGEWEVPEHVLTYDTGLKFPPEHKEMLKFYLDNFQTLVFG